MWLGSIEHLRVAMIRLRVKFSVCVLCLSAVVGLTLGQERSGGVDAVQVDAAASSPAPSGQAAPPATAAAREPNRLRSPYTTMSFFLRTVRDTEKGPDRYAEAMVCLDFSRMDAEAAKLRGPQYVEQLAAILQRLEDEGHFDPENKQVLPDEPTGTIQSFGKDPVVLTLQRLPRVEKDPRTGSERTIQEWKFSAGTVASIPEWYQGLDGLIEIMAAPETGAAVIDAESLSTPYHTTRFFLEKATGARSDGKYYAEAVEALDFSGVATERLQKELGLEDPQEIAAALKQRGPEYIGKLKRDEATTYVDGLERILQALLDAGTLDLSKLPREPDPERKPTWAITTDVILVRQAEGRWRYSAHTVRKVPDLVRALDEAKAAAPTGAEVGLAPATPEPKRPAPEAKPAAIPSVPSETESPRATLETFLTAMKASDLETATDCLDLSRLSAPERELAFVLAGKLWVVLTRMEMPVLQEVRVEPGEEIYELFSHAAGRIQIGRQRTGDRKGEWLFTRRTVRDIESLYEEFLSRPVHESWKGQRLSFRALPSLYIREYVVPATWRGRFLGLEVWQWIGVLLVLLLGVVIRQLCGFLLPRISRHLLATDGVAMLPQLARKALMPASSFAMLLALWGGMQFLDLGATIMSWIWWLLKLAMSVVGVYAAYRLIDVVMGYISARAARTKSRMDDVLVPLIQKTSKVLVVALGAVFFIAPALGMQVTPLVAGLGVGGLAISFAAKDTIANFFGSLNVVLDRPFQVGDWVKIGDTEGTVESVGLRSSRIRTFYNSQITVPNAELMTATIDNMGRRQYRRIRCMISVTYSTAPEQLEALCEAIRELVRRHPYTRKDYYHCYVNQFAASSIDILLYCFHEVPDWGTELRERQRLFVDIIRVANRLGVEFAFPTQTVHLAGDGEAVATTDQAALQRQVRAAKPAPREAKSPVPAGVDQALAFGRETAAAVVAEFQGDSDDKPPPVTY
jgi:MscS family membrane protein